MNLIPIHLKVFTVYISPSVYMHEKVRGQHPGSSSISLFLNFETGSLTNLARLAGQQVSGILLTLPPQCWDYRGTSPCLALTRGIGSEMRYLRLYSKHFTDWTIVRAQYLQFFKAAIIFPSEHLISEVSYKYSFS